MLSPVLHVSAHSKNGVGVADAFSLFNPSFLFTQTGQVQIEPDIEDRGGETIIFTY